MYQGISIPTSIDTRKMQSLSSNKPVSTPSSKILRASDGLEDQRSAFVKFVRDHQCPEALSNTVVKYPFVTADEIKKALKVKASLSSSA